MSTEDSQASDSTEDHRYANICGATNCNGNPCKLPGGWGTPGSGGTRCRFHGELSSDPDDTSRLEENDFEKNSPSGCPPENNDNAAIHGGFSDWRTVYERFRKDPLTRQRIETLVSAYLHTAQNTPQTSISTAGKNSRTHRQYSFNRH